VLKLLIFGMTFLVSFAFVNIRSPSLFLYTPSNANVSQSEVHVTEFNRNKLKNIPLLEFQPVRLVSVYFYLCTRFSKNIPVTLCCIIQHTHIIAHCTRLASSMEQIREQTD
jgi:hypothetical protein